METGEETTVALIDNIPYSRQLRVKRIYARSGLVHATLLSDYTRAPRLEQAKRGSPGPTV